ncbi:MAG: hypothetical protein JWN76_2076 [Chitinophagaceae bacterium]|nr:hypothetical protein [Chitinophagaceae bacterium]
MIRYTENIFMKKIEKYVVLAILLISCNNNSSSNTQSDTTSTTKTDSSNQIIDTSKTNQFGKAMDLSMDSIMISKLTGDADYDFAMMMKYHHDGAVRISNLELINGTDPGIKKIAQKIIEESKKDNALLDSFMNDYKPVSKSAFGTKAMDMMHQSVINGLKVHGGYIDLEFSTLMIQHHEQAIEMAKEYLILGKQKMMKNVAGAILKKEPADIEHLKVWKHKHYPDAD